MIHPVELRPVPIISPLILINKATYGITEKGKQKKMEEIERELYVINRIFERKQNGLPIKETDLLELKKVKGMKEWYSYWDEAEEEYLDVTLPLQRLIEESGGQFLELEPDEIDLIALFGDILPVYSCLFFLMFMNVLLLGSAQAS